MSYYEADCEDQACPPTTTCVRFECQTWSNGVAIRPRLVKRQGFWCCPKCGGSYGTSPHPTMR